MKNKQCSNCSKTKSLSEFYKDKSKKDGYCHQCKECAKEYQFKNKEKIKEIRYSKNNRCLDCGKLITNDAIRCKSCANKEELNPFWKNLKPNYCVDCGKEISPNAKRCNSCNSKYLYKIGILNVKKQNNPYYIDGRTPLRNLIRDSLENKQWIKNVFGKDYYTCQECGKRGCNLQAHHKKMFSEILSEFLEYYNWLNPIEDKYKLLKLSKDWRDFWKVNNGKTLCKDCHKVKPNRRLSKKVKIDKK